MGTFVVVLNKPQVLHTFASFALIMICYGSKELWVEGRGKTICSMDYLWRPTKIVAYLWAKAILLPCTGSCIDNDANAIGVTMFLRWSPGSMHRVTRKLYNFFVWTCVPTLSL